jgi:aminoglycoside 6'-N-acetyltransferase I
MDIVDFSSLSSAQLAEAACILREAIPGPSYKAPGEAEAEAGSFLDDPRRLALAAVDGGAVVGWIGGVRGYSHALELHPLVVDAPWRGRGVGRALAEALEARAAAEGFLTIHLGTDDEVGGTNLFGRDLFGNVLGKLAAIAPTERGHPFFFYRRLGYEPIGLLPDANGPGQPDIYMAKPVAAVTPRAALEGRRGP